MVRSKVIKSRAEDDVYSHYEIQPNYNVQTVIFLDKFQNHYNFEASVRLGKKEYISNAVKNSARQVKLVTLQKAVTALTAANWPAGKPKPKATKTITDNLSVHTWAKSLSNETIAVLFKDILRHFASRENTFEIYTTFYHRERELIGYVSTVNFRGEFKSLGLMTNEDQAEQSAAEVCLRTLGYLPEVDSEKDLTIQPFQGGYIYEGIGQKRPYISTSKLFSNVLDAFVKSNNLMTAPKYYMKYLKSKSKEDGKEKMANCICCVDGKVFEASTLQPENIAIQLAAEKAVNYFGLLNVHRHMEFRRYLRILRYNFSTRRDLVNLGRERKHSVNNSWSWSCFTRDNSYQECEVSKTVGDLLESPFFVSNLPPTEYREKLIKSELKQKPSFKGKSLMKLVDVSVADIDATNPNLVTIGNSEFSIKMWCTEGKIYSKQRKCAVEVLPGHNIRQLSCEYRVSLPSLEVYLHAIDCHDLFYPISPTPVVTSCGVVVLVHHHSASSNGVYVLLQQKSDDKPTNTADGKVFKLKTLLQKLIQPTFKTEVTVAEAMESIEQWNEDDVKLLSELSMESLHKVLSKYGTYDSRWNELFAKQELPEELKEVQDICLKQLKRLEEGKEEKPTSEDTAEKPQQWELPQSEFMSRFDDTGIYIEGSELCGIRSLRETTGMKITLGNIDKCSFIDIPVEDDRKRHRGDVMRYYIWNSNKVGPDLLKDYALFNKQVIQHNGRRYVSNKKLLMLSYLHDINYINTDGSKVPSAAPNIDDNIESKNGEEPMEVLDETKNEESKEEAIEVLDETKDDESKEDMEVFDIEPSDNTDELKGEEESKEVEEQVSESLHEEIDPYSITTDMVEARDPSDDDENTLDEYVHVDEDDIGLSTENGTIKKTQVSPFKRIRVRKRKPFTITQLPTRDAFFLQCKWMILDRAMDVCPMLKKVAESKTFQEELDKVV